MNGVKTMIETYIIRTSSDEFYCGKTKDFIKRMPQHEKEKYPHWFASKKRKKFEVIYLFKGDYEKKIKQFGIRKFCEVMRQISS